MNSLRNLPVLVRGTAEGGFVAECLLLPECRCFGATRHQALETMQALVRSALRSERVLPSHYEIVYLAVERPAPEPASPPDAAGPSVATRGAAT